MIGLLDLQRLLALGREREIVVGIGVRDEHAGNGDPHYGLGESGPRVVGFSTSESLVSALSSGQISAAVRGALSSAEVLPLLKNAFGLDEIMRTAILAGRDGRPFMLAPVGIDEGYDMASKLRLTRATLSYFASIGWSLSVGILSKGRPEDVERGSEIRSSIVEGERMAEVLASEGFSARHYSVLVEDAVRECDLVVAPNGVAGNLMFRSLCLVGGGTAFGAPVVNLPTVFVDTSRARKDFAEALLVAAGLVSARSARCSPPVKTSLIYSISNDK